MNLVYIVSRLGNEAVESKIVRRPPKFFSGAMKIAGTFQVKESLVGTEYEATHYVYC